MVGVMFSMIAIESGSVYEPSQRFGKTIQNAARITDYPFRTTPQTEKIIQRHR